MESMKPINNEAKTGCCDSGSGQSVSSSSVLQMSVVCALIVCRTQLSASLVRTHTARLLLCGLSIS